MQPVREMILVGHNCENRLAEHKIVHGRVVECWEDNVAEEEIFRRSLKRERSSECGRVLILRVIEQRVALTPVETKTSMS